MSLGWTEILVILAVVLLLFGAKRIPELARALGKASFEFKKAKDNMQREADELVKESEASAETAAKKEADSSAAEGNKANDPAAK